VGPDAAAALVLAAGDNPQRLTSEASFAALCGVSPIEASSGKRHRRRLNRGGDRQANSALYTIAIARQRWDRRTQDYVKRRVAEGKTKTEIMRCQAIHLPRHRHNQEHASDNTIGYLTSIGASSAISFGAEPSTWPRSGSGSGTPFHDLRDTP
jgi:transposase